MAFSKSSRNITLENAVLIAECYTSAGEVQSSILDLDRYLGNVHGHFRWEGTNFSNTALKIRIKGSILYARLGDGRGDWYDTFVDLDERIRNEEGHLKFWRRPRNRFSASSCDVILENSILHARCFTPAGESKNSMLDLDDCLGNRSGNFIWGGKRFSASARDVRLKGSMLYARLATDSGPPDDWRDACVDLNDGIVNNIGKLDCDTGGLPWETQHLGNHGGILCRYAPPSLFKEKIRKKRDSDDSSMTEARRITQAMATSNRIPYVHNPLTKRNGFRLLKIEPADNEADVLECSLIEAELNDSPTFAALSYTWGSPFSNSNTSTKHDYEQDMTIICNGQSFPVKQNLHDALRRLRHKNVVNKQQERFDEIDIISGVLSGSLAKVEDMLRRGANVDKRDTFSQTALHYAAKLGHLDIAKALVVAGSNINAICDACKKPLDYAREGCGSYVKSVEDFLVAQHDMDYTVRKTTTSLRLNVTNLNYFWIDAICMNQLDEQEKASQVAIMGQIYRSAEHVVVWLGQEYCNFQDTTEDLLQGVWRLEPAREAGKISSRILEQLANHPVETFQKLQHTRIWQAAIDWMNTQGLETIEKWFKTPPMFQRTWFQRAWILQEVLMAKDLTVVCGRYLLPWDIFILLSSIIECCRILLGTTGLGSVFATSNSWTEGYDTQLIRGAIALCSNPNRNEVPSLRLERWRTAYRCGSQLSILSALTLSRNQNATDARDKVFSVLSFSPIEHMTRQGLKSITPDYTRSAKWLYIEVGKSLLAIYGARVLSLCGSGSSVQTEGLPSWVPDLNSPLYIHPRGIDIKELHSTPSFTSKSGVDFEEDFLHETRQLRVASVNELLVSGYVWDTISEIAHSGLNDIGLDLVGLSRWLEMVFKLNKLPAQNRRILWRTLAEDSTRNDPFTNNQRDDDFRNWLKFLCFCSILGHQENFRTSGLSFVQPDIYYHEKIQRTQPHILMLLQQVRTSFAALGMDFDNETTELWADPHTYASSNHHRFRTYYIHLITEAMKYGCIVRDNDPSRRLLRTSTWNMLGTGPQEAQAGDVIGVVDGVSVPYVLREESNGKFRLIGEAYVHEVDLEQILIDARAQGKIENLCLT